MGSPSSDPPGAAPAPPEVTGANPAGGPGEERASPVVTRGRVLCYRLFDAGAELVLADAERLLLEAQLSRASVVFRAPPSRRAGALAFAAVPLHVDIGTRRVSLSGGRSLVGHVAVNLFDCGTVSMVFDAAIKRGTTLEDLRPLCGDLYESKALDELAREEGDMLIRRVERALRGSHGWKEQSRYTVVFIEELEGRPPARDVLAWPSLPKLLLGEASERPFGDKQREETLRHADGYLDDDLVLVDTNSAFVLEPSGSRDIPDVLEFAASQLLQLRYYDQQLDAELRTIYHGFAKPRRGLRALVASPYTSLVHDVSRRLIEVTELTERIENSFTIIGDSYLARVYRSAVERLGGPILRESVSRKHQLVAAIYETLKGEVELARGLVLEITVMLLIVIEVVLAFVGGH